MDPEMEPRKFSLELRNVTDPNKMVQLILNFESSIIKVPSRHYIFHIGGDNATRFEIASMFRKIADFIEEEEMPYGVRNLSP